MGEKIPKTIRRQVITQWLYGFSRDQIAKDNQIGAGTVSTTIKQCKEQKLLLLIFYCDYKMMSKRKSWIYALRAYIVNLAAFGDVLWVLVIDSN